MIDRKLTHLIVCAARISLLLAALSFSLLAQGKNPVILVPGLSGSELIQQGTGNKVWFKALKPKSGDLRLPISADLAANRDDLIPGDVLRHVKLGIFPVTDVYGGFIKVMEERGGYHEEKWDTPSENGYQDALYVFPYDWRLDNVLNARRLIRDIEDLKGRLKKPGLKFDVVAHSMGGLISRYAAMYGDADLPKGNQKAQPTWAGAKYFSKIILMGTPNEGAVMALSALMNGLTIGGLRIDLPFLHDTSRFTVFTIPTAYQLLPAPGTLRAFDDKLEPLQIDLYDPKVWTKYGWNPIDDKKFPTEFSVAERRAATDYFVAALDRSRRLHEALAAAGGKTGGVSIYLLGSDCKTAPDSIVIYKDEKTDKWKTIFRPKGFTRSDGVKITDDELKAIMMSPGDGQVTRRSLAAASQAKAAGSESVITSEPVTCICEDHNKLATNARVQDYIIGIFSGKTTPAIVIPDKVTGGIETK